MPAAPSTQSPSAPTRAPASETVFGVNELRLNRRQWLITIAIFLSFLLLIPAIWKHLETFHPDENYRLPYALSKDYWLYQRRLELLDAKQIPILGDSVVWGEYVRADGGLSRYLNRESSTNRFANCGVNGLFPLALEGLIENFAGSLRNRRVIVQCNPLWLTSPKADLSTDKEEAFNHSRLVPQFTVRIPCYRANASERLGAVLERNIGFFAWTSHLQIAYYHHHSLAQWTLEDDGNEPPKYPNAFGNPFSPLFAGLPIEPAVDPQRGPASPRHKPWNDDGAQPAHFEWVSPDASLQWRAFQRLTRLLRRRGNDVLVILGPFNEHMIAEDQLPAYQAIRDQMAAGLRQEGVRLIVPEALPSDCYADASHPLTAGYALLAGHLVSDPSFLDWIK